MSNIWSYSGARKANAGSAGRGRNIVVAIFLSGIALIGSQQLFPQMGALRAAEQAQPDTADKSSRQAIIAASPRIAIDTPSLKGSIALKGARIKRMIQLE